MSKEKFAADPAQSAPSAEQWFDQQLDAMSSTGLYSKTEVRTVAAAYAALRTAQRDEEFRRKQVTIDLQMEQIKELLTRAETAESALRDARGFVKKFQDFYPNCAQLLDGWHGDGTAWSEWDTTVRNELIELGKVAALLTLAAQTPEEK